MGSIPSHDACAPLVLCLLVGLQQAEAQQTGTLHIVTQQGGAVATVPARDSSVILSGGTAQVTRVVTVPFGAQSPVSLSIFAGQNDIGTVSHPRAVRFDAAAGTYTPTGNGENMWGRTHSFHFVWTQSPAI